MDTQITDTNSADKKDKFPTFRNVAWDWLLALISLVVVLLPGVLLKIVTLNPNFDSTSPSYQFLVSPVFNSAVVLIAFVLSLISISKTKEPSVRTLALLTLIICIIRFMLPS